MQDFVFHQPVKVIFGRRALAALTAELNPWSDGPVLLVHGYRSSKASGLYQRLCTILTDGGLRFVEHGSVQPNPLLNHVHRGIDTARNNACSAVLAVGGGSVIDSAKAIAAGACVDHDIWKCFTGKKSIRRSLPLICIPTIAGSGSDMNGGMVLTHDGKQRKFGFSHRLLLPRVSLVDPSLTFSVLPQQTAWGAVDIIAHCLEIYLTGAIDEAPLQRNFLEGICRTTMAACRRLQTEPHSYDDRATMLWAASLALSGITTAGVGRIAMELHLLEHALSVRQDIAHGAGLAALLPGWLRFRGPIVHRRLATFGRAVWGLEENNDDKAAAMTIEEFEVFFSAIGCSCSLASWGINEDRLPELIAHCREQARIWRLSEMTDEVVNGAYRCCFSNASS
ncbi:MAG: iron-containing alcohol dehydrogenase [Desulfobulbaceae bacterium]|nr:iron-containing alcohol dehydrogenase [Desulfobulbaceae bacterium]